MKVDSLDGTKGRRKCGTHLCRLDTSDLWVCGHRPNPARIIQKKTVLSKEKKYTGLCLNKREVYETVIV